MSKQLLESERRRRSEADKARKDRERVEQEAKEAEEREQILRDFDMIRELQEAREALGGPYFDRRQNREYRRTQSIRQAEYRRWES